MTSVRRLHYGAMLGVLAVLLTVTLMPYGGRPSALLHMDKTFSSSFTLPSGFVVLNVPGYDGMLYYRIASRFTDFLSPSSWEELRSSPPASYAYQRILLPGLAALVTLQHDALIPSAIFAINVISILLCAYLLLRDPRVHPVFAWAVIFSPAAVVGLHFSLAEPLTLLCLTAFLLRFTKKNTLDAQGALLLAVAVLCREVNILFAAAVGFDRLLRGRWPEVLLTIIPAGVFFALHGWIYGIFDSIPFIESTDKHAIPFTAIGELFAGLQGFDRYALSSITLFLLFVLPCLLLSSATIIKKRRFSFVTWGLGFFIILMLAMPDHIWGSITSIGRVITPVYPLFALFGVEHDTFYTRLIAYSITGLGLVTGLGLALMTHPFTLMS